jgi:hypothetical protein
MGSLWMRARVWRGGGRSGGAVERGVPHAPDDWPGPRFDSRELGPVYSSRRGRHGSDGNGTGERGGLGGCINGPTTAPRVQDSCLVTVLTTVLTLSTMFDYNRSRLLDCGRD